MRGGKSAANVTCHLHKPFRKRSSLHITAFIEALQTWNVDFFIVKTHSNVSMQKEVWYDLFIDKHVK